VVDGDVVDVGVLKHRRADAPTADDTTTSDAVSADDIGGAEDIGGAGDANDASDANDANDANDHHGDDANSDDNDDADPQARRRRHRLRRHGRHRPAACAAPRGADDEAIAAAAWRSAEPVIAVLRGFDLRGDEAIHAERMLRAALHGFVSLELAGGFGLDTDVDTSYRWLAERLVDAL
jgi:hypothetical protein